MAKESGRLINRMQKCLEAVSRLLGRQQCVEYGRDLRYGLTLSIFDGYIGSSLTSSSSSISSSPSSKIGGKLLSCEIAKLMLTCRAE